jgi:sigma-B regulation protein RsbU (phosphoserine phosphatase)
LLESQQTLANELSDAADYVVSLLPPPMLSPFQTAIALVPSAELGGDFCGNYWIDANKLGMFLLDVSGHGIKSALLAVSISNLIKSRGLPGVDFSNPSSVLNSLNLRYQADGDNSVFFTIWYGVYDINSRELHYASGGSPPGVLIRDGLPILLSSGELLLGASDDIHYSSNSLPINSGDRLFLFSDGIYEISRTNNKIFGLDEFIKLLPHQKRSPSENLDDLLNTILALTMNERFSDDVCLFEALFN